MVNPNIQKEHKVQLLASIVVALLSLAIMGSALKNIKESNSTNDILKQQQFIKSSHISGSSFEFSVDLKNRNLFGNDGQAIKYEQMYITDSVEKNKKEVKKYYAEILDEYNLRRLLKLDVSLADVRKDNYKVIIPAKDLLSPNEMSHIKRKEKDLRFSRFEYDYVFFNMRKVRVTYNKDFLPIKLEDWYREPNEKRKTWHVLSVYSYPYKNQKRFNRELDSYIEAIKAHMYGGE